MTRKLHLAPVLAEAVSQMLGNQKCMALQEAARQDIADKCSDMIAGLPYKAVGMVKGLQDELYQRSIDVVAQLCSRILHDLQYGLHADQHTVNYRSHMPSPFHSVKRKAAAQPFAVHCVPVERHLPHADPDERAMHIPGEQPQALYQRGQGACRFHCRPWQLHTHL